MTSSWRVLCTMATTHSACSGLSPQYIQGIHLVISYVTSYVLVVAWKVNYKLAVSQCYDIPLLQIARQREKSTLMVLAHVFLALAPVRNPVKSAPWSVAVGVGVLLVQCLMKRLMLVSMWLTALKVSLWLLHNCSAVADPLTNLCHAPRLHHAYTQTPVHKSAHAASVGDTAPMLSAQCKCVRICMHDETLYRVHPHMHNAHVHSCAFNILALASHSWYGQEIGCSRNVNVLPIHHTCMHLQIGSTMGDHITVYIYRLFCCVWLSLNGVTNSMRTRITRYRHGHF